MVVVEGILLFAVAGLRDCFDLRIFVDTDDDIRLLRRLKRDLTERGRDVASVEAQYYGSVRPMHHLHVVPSRRHAPPDCPRGRRERPRAGGHRRAAASGHRGRGLRSIRFMNRRTRQASLEGKGTPGPCSPDGGSPHDTEANESLAMDAGHDLPAWLRGGLWCQRRSGHRGRPGGGR